jgi:hypothetical protein
LIILVVAANDPTTLVESLVVVVERIAPERVVFEHLPSYPSFLQGK